MGYSLKSLYKEISNNLKPLRKALSLQRQTLSALIFRETKTRFGDQSLGMLWAFGEVLSHILVFWGLWTIIGRDDYNGLSIPMFLISGLVPYFMFRNIFSKSADCVNANKSLLVFSQIKILDFVLSRAIVEFTIYITAMALFVIFLYFFEFQVTLYSLTTIIWGIIVLWLLGIGLGLLYLPFNGKFKVVDTIVNVMLRLSYFISGVMFPIDRVPLWAQEYLQYNPILNIINYIRSGFLNNYIMNIMNINYGFECAIFSFMIGMILLKRLQKMILSDD